MKLNLFPWHRIRQILGIFIGSMVVAMSINSFILPNRIADGGLTGLAIILFYLSKWDVGITVLLLNIPLFFIGYKVIGRLLMVYSILGVAFLSVSLRLTQQIIVITTDPFLASVFGGLVTGIGMGVIFRSQGSLGGTDILAIILTRRTPFSVGQIILGLDAVIFLGAAIIFEPEMAMYAMIYMFIASKIIDLVQVGLNYSKAVMIVTEKHEEISVEILQQLERGVTYFIAEGAYSKTPRKVIYSIVNRAQLTLMKDIIHKIDSNAFVAIGEVSEVLGEGFSQFKNIRD